jgi:hypothetical protein
MIDALPCINKKITDYKLRLQRLSWTAQTIKANQRKITKEQRGPLPTMISSGQFLIEIPIITPTMRGKRDPFLTHEAKGELQQGAAEHARTRQQKWPKRPTKASGRQADSTQATGEQQSQTKDSTRATDHRTIKAKEQTITRRTSKEQRAWSKGLSELGDADQDQFFECNNTKCWKWIASLTFRAKR